MNRAALALPAALREHDVERNAVPRAKRAWANPPGVVAAVTPARDAMAGAAARRPPQRAGTSARAGVAVAIGRELVRKGASGVVRSPGGTWTDKYTARSPLAV